MTDTKPKKKLRRPGNRNRKLSAWQKSSTFANIGANALRKFRANRGSYPRCGANAKTTGERCKQMAMPNGKCRWHGGATPAGTEWGKRQLRAKPPGKQAPSDWRRAEAKLKKRAAEDKDRIRRLQAMSDAEFWRYVRRMGRRLDDRFAPAIRQAVKDEFARRGPDPSKRIDFGAAPSKPASPELREIEDRIAELRAELQTLASPALRGGVFD